MEPRNKSSKKDDLKKVKSEENEKLEKETLDKLSQLEKGFSEMKIKKETLKQNFNNNLKNLLSLWNSKIKNEKIVDSVYLLTAKFIELSISDKELNNFQDNLTNEEKCILVKFYYRTYERISMKQDCLNLKPAKIYSLHQSILAKEGVGIVSRAMFATKK